MKLVLKIIGILIAIILLLMVAIPYFFRDQIAERVKKEINKNLTAQVDFKDFSLSLFRSFPDFNFQLEGLSVVNRAPFEGDTLAYIPAFSLTLDLMSVFRGEAYELKKITLDKPRVNLLVTADGQANWDITMPSQQPPPEEQPADTSSFEIQLRHVSINNGRVVYDDKSLATYVLVEGLNHDLSGDFSLDFTSLKTHTTIDSLTIRYEGINYLDHVNAGLDADVDADLKNSIYTLKQNELRLNELQIVFDGSVAMQENDDINLMLTFSAKREDFKDFLSLVPAIYASNFNNVQTSGKLSLNGNVKGIYNGDHYPAFALNIMVDNGRFQYPDLPKSVENININSKINYPGGTDLDKLTVNVSKFDFTMAGNPVTANLLVKTPLSDPYLKGEVNGKINLGQVKDVYPLEQGDELSGMITSNVSFEGRMSSLEKGNYDAFTLIGSLLVQDLKYKTGMLAVPLLINKAQLNFSPEYLDLVTLKMKLGQSDFSANGRIEQFLPYALSDGTLTGSLQTSSNYFNVSALMAESQDTTAQTTDTAAMEVIEVPDRISFKLTSTFDKLLYDNIDLTNVKGTLRLEDQALILDQLSMNVLDGSMSMNGSYNTRDSLKPHADMNLKLSGLSIQDAYNTFDVMEKLAPIADKTSGTFSASLKMQTDLGTDMMPVYPTMNGSGSLTTSDIIVENVNSLNKIADALKMPDLKRLKLTPVDLSFEIVEGKVNVKPFDIKYQDIKVTIGGWMALDQSIDYDMVLSVPRNKFGSAANSVLENLVSEANNLGANFSLGKTVNIKVNIVGTVSDPKIKTALGKSAGNVVEDLKQKAQEEIQKQKKQLQEKARTEANRILNDAEAQAQKIIDEAQKQAQKIKQGARQTADQVKQEADKQAQNLIDEAKDKGTLAQIGAKAAAKKLRQEANDKAEKLVQEASKQADNIVAEARKKADNIRQQAQQRADNLLKGQ